MNAAIGPDRDHRHRLRQRPLAIRLVSLPWRREKAGVPAMTSRVTQVQEEGP